MTAASTQEKKHIVLIGGGIVGASTAFYLSRHANYSPETHSITIVDSTSIAAAASGKAGGLLADKGWHGSATASLAELSFNLHEQLAKEHGGVEKWGYRRLDVVGLQADLSRNSKGNKGGKGTEGHKGLHGWLGQELVDGMRIRELGTVKTNAQVHPRLLTEELARLSGANIVIAEARSLELDDETHRVKSVGIVARDGQQSSLPADEVVIGAGPWTGKLAKLLLGNKIGGKLGVSGSRAHSIVIKTKEGVEVSPHALFTSLTLPDGSASEPELYPRPDGTVYLCGPTDDEPLPASAAQVGVDTEAISQLSKEALALSHHFTGDDIVARQACYLPLADRGTPLVGKVRGVEGVWIGSGLSCWGITQGPGTGACLAQGIMEGKVTLANISRLAPP